MSNTFEHIEKLITWTNKNSGFLGLILFIATILTGIFKSLIRRPKIKIRFMDKMTFYSFYYTNKDWYNEELNETFELHKTGFVTYMSISNIGTADTSIDKIKLAYYKNSDSKIRFRNRKVWLPQWHSVEPFRLKAGNDHYIEVNTLRLRMNPLEKYDGDKLDVGTSLVGVAYFEQGEAWGNYNPKVCKDVKVKVIVRIIDIYGHKFNFKTKIRQLPIEEARKTNPYFGNVNKTIDE